MSNPFTSAQDKEPSTLTADDLLEAIELVCPVLYYKLGRYVQKGNIYLIRQREKPEGFLASHPEYIIINPEDLDRVKKLITWRTLKPLDSL